MQFGTPDHFRTDYVNFVVADFDGTYHAILGRPSLTKFMAIPHYRYLVLKMPTEKGVLTLRGLKMLNNDILNHILKKMMMISLRRTMATQRLKPKPNDVLRMHVTIIG